MKIERIIEILENEEYEKVEIKTYNNTFGSHEYINVITKEGGKIQISFELERKNSFFSFKKGEYDELFMIKLFIPSKDLAIKKFEIYKNEENYKKILRLYSSLRTVEKIKKEEKYF